MREPKHTSVSMNFRSRWNGLAAHPNAMATKLRAYALDGQQRTHWPLQNTLTRRASERKWMMSLMKTLMSQNLCSFFGSLRLQGSRDCSKNSIPLMRPRKNPDWAGWLGVFKKYCRKRIKWPL